MRHVNIGASAAAVILFTCVSLHAQTQSALPDAETLYHVAATESLSTLDLTAAFQQPAGPPPTPRHTGIKAMAKELVTDVKLLPSKENLMWAIIGGGLALAVHPADDNVNRAVAVHTGGMMQALRKLYDAGALADEIQGITPRTAKAAARR